MPETTHFKLLVTKCNITWMFKRNGADIVPAEGLYLILYQIIKKKARHDVKVWQIPGHIINFMIELQDRICIT